MKKTKLLLGATTLTLAAAPVTAIASLGSKLSPITPIYGNVSASQLTFESVGEGQEAITGLADGVKPADLTGTFNLSAIESERSASIVSIGDDALKNCINLQAIDLSSSNLQTIGERSFYYCCNVTSITFGSGLTEIGQDAFMSCKHVAELTFPSSLESIGYGAFNNCIRLQTVNFAPINSSLQVVATRAFADCTNLTTLNYLEYQTRWSIIENQTFINCYNISSFVIPPNVTEIKNGAFMKAAYNISESEGWAPIDFSYNTALTTIEENAFAYCHFVNFILPETVTTLAKGAFRNSTIGTLYLPGTIKEIPEKCFYQCNIKTLTLNEGLEKIGYQAFFGNSLYGIELYFPDTLQEIGTEAFYQTWASSVSIPNGCKLNSYALYGVYGLSYIDMARWGEFTSAEQIQAAIGEEGANWGGYTFASSGDDQVGKIHFVNSGDSRSAELWKDELVNNQALRSEDITWYTSPQSSDHIECTDSNFLTYKTISGSGNCDSIDHDSSPVVKRTVHFTVNDSTTYTLGTNLNIYLKGTNKWHSEYGLTDVWGDDSQAPVITATQDGTDLAVTFSYPKTYDKVDKDDLILQITGTDSSSNEWTYLIPKVRWVSTNRSKTRTIGYRNDYSNVDNTLVIHKNDGTVTPASVSTATTLGATIKLTDDEIKNGLTIELVNDDETKPVFNVDTSNLQINYGGFERYGDSWDTPVKMYTYNTIRFNVVPADAESLTPGNTYSGYKFKYSFNSVKYSFDEYTTQPFSIYIDPNALTLDTCRFEAPSAGDITDRIFVPIDPSSESKTSAAFTLPKIWRTETTGEGSDQVTKGAYAFDTTKNYIVTFSIKKIEWVGGEYTYVETDNALTSTQQLITPNSDGSLTVTATFTPGADYTWESFQDDREFSECIIHIEITDGNGVHICKNELSHYHSYRIRTFDQNEIAAAIRD